MCGTSRARQSREGILALPGGGDGMESHINGRPESPVQMGASVLTGVVAALALEQVVEGAYQLLSARWGAFSIGDILVTFVVAGSLAVTLARFFQGNSIYLQMQYAVWDPRELKPDSMVSTPVAHMLDVATQIMEYVFLLVAGHLLSTDPGLKTVAWPLIALFVLDGAWSAWGVISLRGRRAVDDIPGRGSATRRTRKTWAWISAVSAAGVLGTRMVVPGWLTVVVPAVLLIALAIDYKFNFLYYFGAPAAPEHIRLTQAVATVEHLAGLARVHCAPLLARTEHEKLKEALDLVFAFFMNHKENARRLFARNSARLHVGLYIERDGLLYPVYRHADAKWVLQNRTFRAGEDYIGEAWVQLDEVGDTRLYHRTNPRMDSKAANRGNKAVSKYYRSSVLVNVFWPPSSAEAEKLGTLTVTSNQEEFFTEGLHEILAVGLAAEVAFGLYRVYGDAPIRMVKERLTGLKTVVTSRVGE